MADPRKDTTANTVNEILENSALRHRLGLDQISGSIRNKVISLLNETDEDIENRLQFRLRRGLSGDAVRHNQLNQLRNELQDINQQIMQDVKSTWTGELEDLSKNEAQFQADEIDRAMPGEVDVETNVPTGPQLVATVASNPMEGNTLSQWAKKIEQDRTDNIMNEVRKGVTAGDSNQEIVDRVMGTRQFGFKDGVLNDSRNNVAAITRTAVTEVSEASREITFRRNQNVIKAVKYVATLDSRTTVICAGLDSQTFPIGEGPRPPQHFGCRSVTVPQTKSWQEMGLNRNDLSASTRSSMDGQVAASKSFEDFMNNKGNSFQKDVLGATRTKLWKQGDLELTDFLKRGVRKNNEVLSVGELKQKFPDEFSRVMN
jgi:SPP1 gp7 family putative phage head morphogenesis protein